MSQSLARVVIHVVFSTKERRAWLKNRELCERLYAYMATVLRNEVDSSAILINGYEDHIHVLCQLSRKFAVADVIKASKTETSKWLKKQSTATRRFTWQAGYGAFSVSESKVPDAKRYIAGQLEHHQGISYQDEFRTLCQRHGICLDERYAWD
jgi:putative transposase